MPTIYLLRHCEYSNPRNILPGRLPVELSQTGITQATLLQEEFAHKNIEKYTAVLFFAVNKPQKLLQMVRFPSITILAYLKHTQPTKDFG